MYLTIRRDENLGFTAACARPCPGDHTCTCPHEEKSQQEPTGFNSTAESFSWSLLEAIINWWHNHCCQCCQFHLHTWLLIFICWVNWLPQLLVFSATSPEQHKWCPDDQTWRKTKGEEAVDSSWKTVLQERCCLKPVPGLCVARVVLRNVEEFKWEANRLHCSRSA